MSSPPSRCRRSPRHWRSLCLTLAVAFAPVADALDATVGIAAIDLPDGSARGVNARFDWSDDGQLRASIAVDEVRRGDASLGGFRLDCGVAQWTGEVLGCGRAALFQAGDANARQPLLRNLDVSYHTGTGRLTVTAGGDSLGGGDTTLSLAGAGGDWSLAVQARRAPAAAWRRLLQAARLWPSGYDEVSGSVDVDARARMRGGHVEIQTLHADVSGLTFSGAAIADAASLHVDVASDHVDGRDALSADVTLDGGAVYVEPGLRIGDYVPGVTLEPDGKPIAVGVRVSAPADGGWRLDRLTVDQPDVLRLALQAGGDDGRLLHAELTTGNLAQLYATHLKSHCARLPALCGLELDGGLSAQAAWDAQGIRDLALSFKDVYLDDDRQRFRIYGLQGDLVLDSGTQARRSSLQWQRAGWQRLDFGAGHVGMSSHDRALKVTEWSDVDLLDGKFKVGRLELANVGRRDFSITMQGVLTPVQMPAFCEAMGWPPMQGTLSGVIPGLSYRHGRLELDGDLLLRIFGGNVVIRGLQITQPFGASPSLATDLDVRNIDLELLTGAFSFGKIQGTLEGQVRDLRLDNWEATAFDGYLQNPEDDDRPHRISQKAVDNLSAIGGGISGVLSRGFLRFFQDYSYERLGLHCQLVNGICAMKGVAPAGDGFYIVTRGGLLPPWIDVRGSGVPLPDGRFAVSWNDILLGLKRINSGQMSLQR